MIELSTLLNLAWLVPGLPFLAFIINFFFFRKSAWITSRLATLFMAGSALISWKIFYTVWTHPKDFLVTAQNWQDYSSYFEWLPLDPSYQSAIQKGFSINIGVFLDPLSVMMLAMVASIATLIHIYSIGYMHGDPGKARFFLYLSLFTFSMLGMVSSNNFMQMFIFWELVGLCSYLLIGFYINKKSAGDAAKKAFIVTRFADFGFMVGLVLLAWVAHDFNFFTLSTRVDELSGIVKVGLFTFPFLPMFSLMIFMGAMGKSGQFPFHIWLPDAMEGPTPVSALIHAATMVTAGVFMLARCFPLFHSGNEMEIIAYIGGFTALFAATIAIVQFDVKKILAYSTLSQLGYMVMGMGIEGAIVAGNPATGVFHLFTHAFFKALLFLGAGSLIHAAHTNDIRQMGNMGKYAKITSITFLIGTLALCGFPPFAGFYSKDAIIHAAHVNGFHGLYILGTITAFLTSFYMARCLIYVFCGEYRGEGTPHESSFTMTFPLVVLAICSIFVGWVQQDFTIFLSGGQMTMEPLGMSAYITSIVIVILGFGSAYAIFHKKVISPEAISKAFVFPHFVLEKKYFMDEIWDYCIRNILLVVSWICATFDKKIVDGVLVDGWDYLTHASARVLKQTQTGVLHTYIFVGLTSTVIFICTLFIN
ncbi:MAG: NADH-quinone oxidoreductase subunit L [Candidatus Cloacimonetes bacterium]|nr:NADH-quinone oxidoreductase subunit L [Candidatus Cloacimonadota bacterium]